MSEYNEPGYDDFPFALEQAEANNQNPNAQPSAHATINTLFDYVELFALTVLFILLATLFLFRHAVVDGNSMNHTLEHQELLIISDLFYSPSYGDIIVFEDHEGTGLNEPLVKRVIATAGQTVIIRESGVWVDGKQLKEEYAYLDGGNTSNYMEYAQYLCAPYLRSENGESFYRYEVGENEVFVMGDNRFNSHDGRMFGPISEDGILGHVLFRMLPLSKIGEVN